jgi:AAA15 family ATPase/GTPase
MKYIEKVEIQYFRSINNQVSADLNGLNIFTGKNDAGKSNVLKALNLFFNGQTDWESPFSFERDFNRQRLEYARTTGKVKQFIRIGVTFNSLDRATNTLPSQFKVTKEWYRDISEPKQYDDIEKRFKKLGVSTPKFSQRSLTTFLSNIQYIYVPAIKDSRVFEQALNTIRETVYTEKLNQNKLLQNGLLSIETEITTSTKQLNVEFTRATSIDTNLASPRDVLELYKTLSVNTKYNKYDIPLTQRGDGIRLRYLPNILNFVSESSNRFFIWGFEEPENSLEYGLAEKMAQDFSSVYVKHAQILLTSHSPAFIRLSKNETIVNCYRSFNKEDGTKIIKFDPYVDNQIEKDLAEELGYVKLLQETFDTYDQKLKDLENNIAVLKSTQKPVLYVEDKYPQIYKIAWLTLKGIQYTEKNLDSVFNRNCDFTIHSAGGASKITGLLHCNSPDVFNVDAIVGLFDYDYEGSQQFCYVYCKQDTSNGKKAYDDVKGDIITGQYIARNDGKRISALILPIPERLENLIYNNNLSHKNIKGNDLAYNNFVEIETLISQSFYE